MNKKVKEICGFPIFTQDHKTLWVKVFFEFVDIFPISLPGLNSKKMSKFRMVSMVIGPQTSA
jgi:hypothetical protein